MSNSPFNEIPIELLQLDLENPRFGLLPATDQLEAIRILVANANIRELWSSIAVSGFLRFEPLIAIPSQDDPDHFIVIEGNRRLAACKTLLDPTLLNGASLKRVPILNDEQRTQIATLPVMVVRERSDADAFIGFKHVNGPATWSSLAKARFGVRMLEDLSDKRSKREKLAELSNKLGDSRNLLLRVFVGYKIYRQALELEIVEEPPDNGKPIEFSHLYTMLNNPPTREFLGLPEGPLSEESIVDNPIHETHHEPLRELFGWLYGGNSVIRSQGTDRPKLQKVIASSEGLDALRTTGDLNYAYGAAGLDAIDWDQKVSTCLHNARMVDDGAIEILEFLSSEDAASVLSRVMKAELHLKSVSAKLQGRAQTSDPTPRQGPKE